jgi:hypothetical protein
MTLYAGEQLSNAAPTCNGASQRFDMLVSFTKGESIEQGIFGKHAQVQCEAWCSTAKNTCSILRTEHHARTMGLGDACSFSEKILSVCKKSMRSRLPAIYCSIDGLQSADILLLRAFGLYRWLAISRDAQTIPE